MLTYIEKLPPLKTTWSFDDVTNVRSRQNLKEKKMFPLSIDSWWPVNVVGCLFMKGGPARKLFNRHQLLLLFFWARGDGSHNFRNIFRVIAKTVYMCCKEP